MINTKTVASSCLAGYTQGPLNDWERLFDSALAEYAATATTGRISLDPSPTSRAAVVRLLESVRRTLFLTADEVAAVAGISPRRFYELVEGKTFQDARLATISERASIIQALAARDWQTTRILVRARASETLELLNRGAFAEIRELFARTQQERTSLLDASRDTGFLNLTIDGAREVNAVLQAPGFNFAAQIVHLVGRADTMIVERSEATVELVGALRAVRDDEDYDESFDFLIGLNDEARDAFQDRAMAFIRSDEFDPRRWKAFVGAESEQAWAGATTVRLEPLDISIETYADEDEPDLSWQPDLSRIGTDFRLFDRRQG